MDSGVRFITKTVIGLVMLILLVVVANKCESRPENPCLGHTCPKGMVPIYVTEPTFIGSNGSVMFPTSDGVCLCGATPPSKAGNQGDRDAQ